MLQKLLKRVGALAGLAPHVVKVGYAFWIHDLFVNLEIMDKYEEKQLREIVKELKKNLRRRRNGRFRKFRPQTREEERKVKDLKYVQKLLQMTSRAVVRTERWKRYQFLTLKKRCKIIVGSD